jgi:hypothetical protein
MVLPSGTSHLKLVPNKDGTVRVYTYVDDVKVTQVAADQYYSSGATTLKFTRMELLSGKPNG